MQDVPKWLGPAMWIACTSLALPTAAWSQVFRCDVGGKVEYRSTPCDGGASQRALPGQAGGVRPAPAPQATPAPTAGAAPAPSREREACDTLAREFDATVAEIRSLWSRLRQERTFGGNTLTAYRLQDELGNQRVRRTMLAHQSYPGCEFARKGLAYEVAKGRMPTENEENGLTAAELQACNALQVELHGLRSRTGHYQGKGYAGISRPGADTEALAKQHALETRMNDMRCPQG